jgi:hypothetical protein
MATKYMATIFGPEVEADGGDYAALLADAVS